jgi:hypothetical protein
MKKLIPILILLLSCVYVESASYFNEHQTPSNFVQVDHFVLREVRAHRAINDNYDFGVNEEEDHWKIYFHFTASVSDVKISLKAIDGTNDHDTREYSYSKSSLIGNTVYSIEHQDFPTYVDNMEVTISYTHSNEEYSNTIYIYTEGEPDQGSEPLAVTTTEIPEAYRDSDGNGVWDSEDGIGGKLNVILQAVKTPFNFLMWLTSASTQVGLLFAFIIMFLSFWAMMRVPVAISGWLFIPFLVGLYFFISVILEGVGVITA